MIQQLSLVDQHIHSKTRHYSISRFLIPIQLYEISQQSPLQSCLSYKSNRSLQLRAKNTKVCVYIRITNFLPKKVETQKRITILETKTKITLYCPSFLHPSHLSRAPSSQKQLRHPSTLLSYLKIRSILSRSATKHGY